MYGAHEDDVERRGKRRGCQYSLRLLMAVVTLCAVGLGLVLWRVRERDRAVAAVRELGGSVILGDDTPGPDGLHALVPSRMVVVDLANTRATNESLAPLASQTALRTLKLDDTSITPGGLASLNGLTSLESLSLAGTRITDADLVHLAALRNLARLDLHGTQLTDAGLEHLGGLASLEDLDVRDTRITDAGIRHLGRLTRLRRLSLDDGRITEASIEHLRKLSALQTLVVLVPRGTGKEAWTLLRALSTVAASGLLPPEGPAVWEVSRPWETSRGGVAEAISSTVELRRDEQATLLAVLASTATKWTRRRSARLAPKSVTVAAADRIETVEDFVLAVRTGGRDHFNRARLYAQSHRAKEGIPALLELLEDPDYEVRRRSAFILIRIGLHDQCVVAALARMLKHEAPMVRAITAYTFNDAPVAYLYGHLGLKIGSEQAEVAVRLLSDASDDEDWEVRSAVADGLESIVRTNPELAGSALPVLLELLQDQHVHVRADAAHALGAFAVANAEEARSAVPVLVERLRKQRDAGLKVATVEALGGVVEHLPDDAAAAVPLFLKELRERDTRLTEAAAEALGRIVEENPQQLKAIVPELLRMLEDPAPAVNSAAERTFRALAEAICERARQAGDRSSAGP